MDDFTDRRVVRVGVLAVVMLVWLAPDATAARATPALGTITVNTLADNETPGDGFCTLREAIDNANSDGDFSGGDCKPGSPLDFIGFSVSGTIAVLGPGGGGALHISDLLTINGGNAITISGGSGGSFTRILALDPGVRLTLQGLVLTDGYAGNAYGGAIYVDNGTLVLDHTTVQNSHTNGWAGSAIFTSGGSVSILNNSVIQDNYGSDYGAVNSTGVVTVTNSIVRNNHATAGGGAFSVVDLRVDGSQIYGNSVSAGSGGAIYVPGGRQASIRNSQLWANQAQSSGGGIYSEGTLALSNVSLSGNSASASSGGGIYNFRTGTATLDHVTFSGNTAAADGGGMYSYGTTTLTNVSLSGNSAATGGGLYTFDSLLTLTSVTISGNSAGSGGGMADDASVATLTNVSLSGNRAADGGGIWNSGQATLTNVTLSGNSASVGGGGINNTRTLALGNVTVSGNSAQRGGGLLNRGAATLRNVTVSNNVAAAQGGALYMDVGHTTVLTNTILAYSPSGGDCAGSVTASKLSFARDPTCAFPAGNTIKGHNPNGLDPLLDGLGNYGGPTLVHMPKASSPAVDGVVGSDAPATDQRGVQRPKDGDGDGISAYDIGAVERQPSDVDVIPRLWLAVVRR